MRQTMMEIYENQWLNNDVIDFYMKMLHERDMMLCVQDKSRRSSHYYSCYFMTLLLPPNGYNYSNEKLVEEVQCFRKEKIFCPINVNASHWSMLVIYIQEKRIAYYDSMQVHGKKYLDGALQYLVDESLTMNRPFDKEQWTLITYADGLPLQENDYDCGVFALMYADFITDDLPLVFGQQHMELFRKKCVFLSCEVLLAILPRFRYLKIYKMKNDVCDIFRFSQLLINSTFLQKKNTKRNTFLLVTLCDFSLRPLKKWPEPSKPHVNLPVEKHRGRN